MIFFVSLLFFSVLGGHAAPFDDFYHDPMENSDLFEGDIEMDVDEDDRSAVVLQTRLWTNGIVPYVLDSELNKTVDKKTIRAALKEYSNKTCLKFISRKLEKDYIRFITGVGCHTKVGKQGGEHSITLGRGCGRAGIVMHELGHALGFYHEHNRSDRHKYIKVIWENVEEGKESQFKQRAPGTDTLLSPFDYNSVMLYGSNAFSKDKKSLKTMVSMTNRKLTNIKNRYHLSDIDVVRTRKLYKCD